MEFIVISEKSIISQVHGIARQAYGEDAIIEIVGDDDKFTISITPFDEIGMYEEERSNIDHSKEDASFKSGVTKIYKDNGRVVRYED